MLRERKVVEGAQCRRDSAASSRLRSVVALAQRRRVSAASSRRGSRGSAEVPQAQEDGQPQVSHCPQVEIKKDNLLWLSLIG